MSRDLPDVHATVLSHVRAFAPALAATTAAAALAIFVFRPDPLWGVLVAIDLAGVALFLGVGGMARRAKQAAHAHALAFALFLVIATLATAGMLVSRITDGDAYVPLFMLFGSFLVLSWAWFGAIVAVSLAMGVALLAGGLSAYDQNESIVFVLTGMLLAGGIQHSRQRVARRTAAAVRDALAARASAAAAEARLRAVFEADPTGLVVADAATLRITQVNAAACRMLGFEKKELLGQPAATIISPASYAGHLDVAKRMREGAGVVESEKVFERRDGKTIRARVRGVLGSDGPGSDPWMLAHIEDVTELRAREEELLLRSHMLQSIGQAVMVTDLQGKILYWNRAAERMYGWTAAEAVGRNVLDTTPTSASAAEAARIFERLLAGETWSGDFEVRRKDGTSLWARVTDAPLRDPDGKLAGVIGISEDITEHRRTEEALRRAERDAALGTLVAGVAHEINNPLQFMGGHLDLLEMDIASLEAPSPGKSLSEEDRATLAAVSGDIAVIRKGLDQVAHITRALRQVARRSEGPKKAEELAPLIDTVLATARPRIGPDVDVRVDLAQGAKAFVSAEAVIQVLLNLTLNAAEAMEGRGTLTLRTREGAGVVTIEVEDTGKGISPDAAAQIFTPFYTTKPEGTGLGLSISRRLAHDQGGELTFESHPGRTTFRLALPTGTRAVIEPPKPHIA